MSLEVEPIASPPLTVSIPSSTSTSTPSSLSTEEGPSSLSSSLDSSQASSPTGIQDSSTSTPTSASCSSLPIHHLTIKFAPLPELAPRKRRSTAPLGMAARTQLTRRRRGSTTAPHSHSHSHSHSPTTAKESVVHPMWTEEEMEEHKRRQVEQRRLRSLKVSGEKKGVVEERGEGEEGVDDPLMVLGRMVKVAGKQLWRKVSHRDRDRKEKGKTKSNEDVSVRLGLTTTTTTTNSSSGEDKTEDTPTKAKEDEDWEDANDFSNVGQTETFLEAPYSHSS